MHGQPVHFRKRRRHELHRVEFVSPDETRAALVHAPRDRFVGDSEKRPDLEFRNRAR